jgi:hypothetical protein
MKMAKVTKKEIAKEVCKDIGDLAKDTAIKAGEVAFALTFPIFGNLSRNLQEKIETISKGLYDARISSMGTYIFNPLAYALLGIYLGGNYVSQNPEQKGILAAAGAGAVYGLWESCMRAGISNRKKTYLGDVVASVPGKMISLPFDGAYYIGTKFKDYLSGITERIERRKKLEEKINGEDKNE